MRLWVEFYPSIVHQANFWKIWVFVQLEANWSALTLSSAHIRELEEIVQAQALQIENAERNEQDLRATINSQQQEMMDLKQQMEETNESNKRNEEQMAILKKKQETTDSLLLRLMSQSPIN